MSGYAREVRAQVGPLVPVVVARVDLPAGKVLNSSNIGSYLRLRRVPERFVPPPALRLPEQALGLRPAYRIAAGSYVDRAALRVGDRAAGRRSPSRIGARPIELPVAGAASLADTIRPGARVDVLVTSEQGGGAPRTYLALQRVELLDLRASDSGEGGAGTGHRADSVATLRVTLRQAVLLTAAQNFAREVRLVPRPDGDERLLPATAVGASDLHP